MKIIINVFNILKEVINLSREMLSWNYMFPKKIELSLDKVSNVIPENHKNKDVAEYLFEKNREIISIMLNKISLARKKRIFATICMFVIPIFLLVSFIAIVVIFNIRNWEDIPAFMTYLSVYSATLLNESTHDFLSEKYKNSIDAEIKNCMDKGEKILKSRDRGGNKVCGGNLNCTFTGFIKPLVKILSNETPENVKILSDKLTDEFSFNGKKIKNGRAIVNRNIKEYSELHKY